MLKKLLLATVLTGAAAVPVLAADTAIILWNGPSVVTETGTGSVDVGPQDLGGIVVTLTTANRLTDPNGLNEANILITNTDKAVETLHMIVGANNYLGNADAFKLSSTILVNAVTGVKSEADLSGSFFVDGLDTLNGQTESVVGTDIKNFDSAVLTGPNSFSFNGSGFDKVTGPYGLAESLTLTLQPGASVGVQGISMVAVPEPQTWALLGAGFALMGLFGFWRTRTTRYAI